MSSPNPVSLPALGEAADVKTSPTTNTDSQHDTSNLEVPQRDPNSEHQSFLSLIAALGNSHYRVDESADKEDVPDFDMTSSIHTIYKPIHRRRTEEQMSSSILSGSSSFQDEPRSDATHMYESLSEESGASGESEDDLPATFLARSRESNLSGGSPTSWQRKKKHKSSLTPEERRELLAAKLKEIFDLKELEPVIAEHRAYLFRSVVLQGFLYITLGHLCFYAYLPSTDGQVVRSGALSKRAKTTGRFHRHWFILKDNVLRWYPSASEPYFPDGDVSLHYVTCIESSKTHPTRFKILANDRKLVFAADSTASRDEWVKTLKKAVFTCQNENDSVKISIPLESVISVQQTNLNVMDALMVKVCDVENGSSSEEYYFCHLPNLPGAVEQVQLALDTFRSSHPALIPTSLSKAEEESSLTSSVVTEAPLTRVSSRQQATQAITSLASKLNLFAGSTSASTTSPAGSIISSEPHTNTTLERSVHERRPSTDTITHPRPQLLASTGPASHTYPPDVQPTTTDPSHESTGSNWTVSSSLRSAAKLISSVKPTLPALPSFASTSARIGSSVASDPARRIVETVDGPSSKPRSSVELDTTARATPSNMFGLIGYQEDVISKYQDDLYRLFNLPSSEKLRYCMTAHIYRGIPIHGRAYLSNSYLCFRSTNILSGTKMILPLIDVVAAQKNRSYRYGYYGLVLTVKGHEELFFDLSNREKRDTIRDAIEQQVEYAHQLHHEGQTPISSGPSAGLQQIKALEDLKSEDETSPLPSAEEIAPIMFHSTSSSFLDFRPKQSMLFTCLAIGSRGDVQPYIALCKGLIEQGHRCRLASHKEYRAWVEGHGIEFRDVGGDPAELMRICVQHGMFTLAFMRETFSNFRGWLDELLETAWGACQGTDVLIESPSTMAGIHIAEALQIPYFRAFTMPWTRTRTYPHAQVVFLHCQCKNLTPRQYRFAIPEHKLGGQYNYLSYTMFDTVFWHAISGQVNRWRKNMLSLPPTSLEKMEQGKVPFLYNLSPQIMPKPLDWPEWVHVTGYWFLDTPDDSTTRKWEAPLDLVDFIASRRKAGKKIVYIGFGSIVVPDPIQLTQTVHQAVEQAGVAAIVSKGWSSRLSVRNLDAQEQQEHERQQREERLLLDSSEDIYTVESIPHDWLFPQIDAACHHGGSGTTGASLRAGLPTIIKPFFGDQFFQADRVETLGVGTCLKKLTTHALSAALTYATSNERVIKKAAMIGRDIRQEDGVGTAIETIYRDLEYARSLIKRHKTPEKTRPLRREPTDDTGSEDSSSWDQLSSNAADDVLSRSGIGSTPPLSRFGDDASEEERTVNPPNVHHQRSSHSVSPWRNRQ